MEVKLAKKTRTYKLGYERRIEKTCIVRERHLRDPELAELGLEKTYTPKDVEVRLQKTYRKDVYRVRVSS